MNAGSPAHKYVITMKMKYQKSHILLMLGVALLLFMGGCTRVEEDQPTPNSAIRTYPDQESWNSNISITRDGRRIADIWAGYIAVYNNQQKIELKDSIHVDFFDKNGHHNSVLTADSGIVYQNNNNLEAMGHVVVISDSGVILKTERLNWDNKKQKIVSDVPVQFTTPQDTLIGDSFVSDPDLKNYEIKNARGYSRRKIPVKKRFEK